MILPSSHSPLGRGVIGRSIVRIPLYHMLDMVKIDTNSKSVQEIVNEMHCISLVADEKHVRERLMKDISAGIRMKEVVGSIWIP